MLSDASRPISCQTKTLTFAIDLSLKQEGRRLRQEHTEYHMVHPQPLLFDRKRHPLNTIKLHRRYLSIALLEV